jgi:hypothetical protein
MKKLINTQPKRNLFVYEVMMNKEKNKFKHLADKNPHKSNTETIENCIQESVG